MAPIKFFGSVDDLKSRVASIHGNWTEESSGKHTFRSSSGAVLNFWPSRNTIQLQGKPEAHPEIEALLADDAVGEHPRNDFVQANPQDEKQKIFIVHGHDTEARDQLELALRRLGLEPFILMNSSAQGKTLIEALEGHIGADYSAAYGIVLMTPDDMGYAMKDGEEKIEPRARQNVISTFD